MSDAELKTLNKMLADLDVGEHAKKPKSRCSQEKDGLIYCVKKRSKEDYAGVAFGKDSNGEIRAVERIGDEGMVGNLIREVKRIIR